MIQQKSKRELLRNKVIALVKEFIETEGGITIMDLQDLFGVSLGGNDKIATYFAKMPIKLLP